MILIGISVLFFYAVFWIERPVSAFILTALTFFAVYLSKKYHRRHRKYNAETKAEAAKKRIEENQQYLTEYFEKRNEILKQFDHLD